MKKDLMRRHILEKSLELFSREAADRLTMDEIARFCSITKPTIYTYFKNKEAILFALFNVISDKLLERLRRFYSEYRGDRRSWDCFENVFDEIIAFFQAYRQILLLLIRETHKGGCGDDVDEHLKSWMEKREELMDFFVDILTPLIKPAILEKSGGRMVAIVVFQVISGILTEFFFSERVDAEQYKLFLKELFQNGIFHKEGR